MSDNTAVTVKLLERDIKLACPPEEVDNLHAAAKHLDAHLRDLRKRAASSSPEKLALVAAMNMTSQLLRAQHGGPDIDTVVDILGSIESTVETALSTDAEGVAEASTDPVEDVDHSTPATPAS
ncbi:MAG: cell division protein ZapA [Pseudomonadota bacterium]